MAHRAQRRRARIAFVMSDQHHVINLVEWPHATVWSDEQPGRDCFDQELEWARCVAHYHTRHAKDLRDFDLVGGLIAELGGFDRGRINWLKDRVHPATTIEERDAALLEAQQAVEAGHGQEA